MKKIAIILMALFLSGCVIDNSATKQVKVDPFFQFKEDITYTEIGRKAVWGSFYLSRLYTIYTTSEQTAYLLTGASQFSIKINDIEVENIKLNVGEYIETNTDTIYEIHVDIEAWDEQLEQIGPSISSLKISYKDQSIIHFNHSPIYIVDDFNEFGLVGGYKENPDDVSSLGLENNSSEDLRIQQLFIEGFNGERYVIHDEAIFFKRRDTIKLPFNRQVLEQQRIEGVIGVYALLEDGREIFLTEGPFRIENYKEQMIEKLIQSIDNK